MPNDQEKERIYLSVLSLLHNMVGSADRSYAYNRLNTIFQYSREDVARIQQTEVDQLHEKRENQFNGLLSACERMSQALFETADQDL